MVLWRRYAHAQLPDKREPKLVQETRPIKKYSLSCAYTSNLVLTGMTYSLLRFLFSLPKLSEWPNGHIVDC